MHIRDIKLYKGQRSKVLSALTFNDAAYWGADLFVATTFALFITQNIEGGSATHLGIIYGLYRIVRAVLALPIGRFFDRHKGYLDELWALAFSGLLVGSIYLVLFCATHLWQVYVCMIFIAIGHALSIGSWTIVFYASMTKNQQGEIIGVYQTIMQIIYGLSAVLAGFVGDAYGFEWTMFIAGFLTILSGIAPLTVRSVFAEKGR